MRDSTDYQPIRPELLAEKLKRARNFENEDFLKEITDRPRLVEALWFLQYVSNGDNYAGGLRRFALDLIADSRDLLGAEIFHGPTEDGVYPESVTLEIAEQFGRYLPDSFGLDLFVEFNAFKEYQKVAPLTEEERQEIGWPDEGESYPRKPLPLNTREVLDYLEREANDGLASYLYLLCERIDVGFTREGTNYTAGARAPWYFPRVGEALLRFMDRRAVQIAAKGADTEVRRQIFRALDRAARLPGLATFIEGGTRAGKSDGIKTHAKMFPGRERLLKTPPEGGVGDVERAIANTLGIVTELSDRTADIRAKIAVVLKEAKLLLIFDEAQYIYPSEFTRKTTPRRLNYIRDSVLDEELSCVLVWTEQSHEDARARFIKATGYAMGQWDGRVAKTLQLPKDIGAEDMLSIARKWLPGLPEAFAEMIVGALEGKESNYCSDVSTIAKFAFLNAEDGKRTLPSLADLESAISEFFQGASRQPAARVPTSQPVSIPLRQACSSDAVESPRPGRANKPSRRANQPTAPFTLPQREISPLELTN
jgi:hypothetical protein